MYNQSIKERPLLSFYSIPGCKKEFMPKRIVDIQGMDYVNATCEHLGLNIENVAKKGRKTINVYARQLAVYLMAMNTHLSLNDMKHLFGGSYNRNSLQRIYQRTIINKK